MPCYQSKAVREEAFDAGERLSREEKSGRKCEVTVAMGRGKLPAKREQPTSAGALDGSERRAKRGPAKGVADVRLSGRGPARHSLRSVSRRTATSSGCGRPKTEKPNQAPEPTPTSVTPRADARVAPAAVVAHLGRSTKELMRRVAGDLEVVKRGEATRSATFCGSSMRAQKGADGEARWTRTSAEPLDREDEVRRAAVKKVADRLRVDGRGPADRTATCCRRRTSHSEQSVDGRFERLQSVSVGASRTMSNQAPEPTALLVTIRACARLAPSSAVAHL